MYFCKKSTTSRDINDYRDDITPLTYFETGEKGKKQLFMLMTAEDKWKLEKNGAICRIWLKMVLSMHDIKAEAL